MGVTFEPSSKSQYVFTGVLRRFSRRAQLKLKTESNLRVDAAVVSSNAAAKPAEPT